MEITPAAVVMLGGGGGGGLLPSKVTLYWRVVITLYEQDLVVIRVTAAENFSRDRHGEIFGSIPISGMFKAVISDPQLKFWVVIITLLFDVVVKSDCGECARDAPVINLCFCLCCFLEVATRQKKTTSDSPSPENSEKKRKGLHEVVFSRCRSNDFSSGGGAK